MKTLFIEPGSPWEDGYNESFNGTLRNELLKREIFYSLQEAKVLIEQWRREYNTVRPHSSLAYRPPSPEAIRPDPKLLNLPLLLRPLPQPKGGPRTNTVGGTALGGRSPRLAVHERGRCCGREPHLPGSVCSYRTAVDRDDHRKRRNVECAGLGFGYGPTGAAHVLAPGYAGPRGRRSIRERVCGRCPRLG